MSIGQCRLCLNQRPLCNSHALPNSVFKSILRKNAGNAKVIFYDVTTPARNSSDTWGAELLCKDCEAKLNHKYDAYGMAVFRGYEGRVVVHAEGVDLLSIDRQRLRSFSCLLFGVFRFQIIRTTRILIFHGRGKKNCGALSTRSAKSSIVGLPLRFTSYGTARQSMASATKTLETLSSRPLQGTTVLSFPSASRSSAFLSKLSCLGHRPRSRSVLGSSLVIIQSLLCPTSKCWMFRISRLYS